MVEFQFICPFFDSSDNNLLLSEFFFVLELPPESDDGAVFGLGVLLDLVVIIIIIIKADKGQNPEYCIFTLY